MALISFDAFVPHVVNELPQCPEPVIAFELRNALIDFCDRSLAWQEPIDTVRVIAGRAEYELDAPAQARISTVVEAVFDDREIHPMTIPELMRKDRNWRSQVGHVSHYVNTDPETIRLYRIPEQDGVLNMIGAFAPTRNGTLIPSYIYERYMEAVRFGCLYRLMRQQAKPWSNPSLAQSYESMFLAKCLQAKAFVNKGQSRADSKVKQMPFA